MITKDMITKACLTTVKSRGEPIADSNPVPLAARFKQ
jgi:hypothetical protein